MPALCLSLMSHMGPRSNAANGSTALLLQYMSVPPAVLDVSCSSEITRDPIVFP